MTLLALPVVVQSFYFGMYKDFCNCSDSHGTSLLISFSVMDLCCKTHSTVVTAMHLLFSSVGQWITSLMMGLFV